MGIMQSESKSGPAAAPLPGGTAVAVVYADDVETGGRVTASVLGATGLDPESTSSRSRFLEVLRRADVGIAAFGSLGTEEALWLRAVTSGPLAGPPCVAVAPLSIEAVQRCRSFDPARVRVVWIEELESRLPQVLRELRRAHHSPLRSLGERVIARSRPRPVVAKALALICNISSNGSQAPPPPPPSVNQLARTLGIGSSPLRRYWAEDLPLCSGPKLLLRWASLLWAMERRADGDSWQGIAGTAGTTIRTLQRNSRELAGCTLSAAAASPRRVHRRFEAWRGGAGRHRRRWACQPPPLCR